jgi:acetolactate synthase small subunit
MKKTVQYNIVCENKPGVLYRLANILLKRKINIETLIAHPVNHQKFPPSALPLILKKIKLITLANKLKK